MANPDAPFGLRPVKHLNGSPWNGVVERCYVSASYATALFVGDPVDIDTTLTDKTAAAKHQTIIKATAGDGNYVYGVIVGFEPNPDNLSRIYSPASTAAWALVCNAPDVIYHIRDDGAATPTYVFPGQNANLIFTHTGNTTTGISQAELDTNSDPPAADASNQLYILKLADIENNDLGTHAIWEVLLSTHRLSGVPGILGVTSA